MGSMGSYCRDGGSWETLGRVQWCQSEQNNAGAEAVSGVGRCVK